jgi:hypothetical protein
VRDPQKVREILKTYVVRGVEIRLRKRGPGGTLVMAFKDEDPGAWEPPLAFPRSQWPRGDPHPDEDERDADERGETESDTAYQEKGAEGFRAFLGELAPYLETPLVVLLAYSEDPYSYAHVWRVEPGAREVEVLGFPPVD